MLLAALIALMTAGPDEADRKLQTFMAGSNFVLAGEVLADPVQHPKPFRWWGDEKQPGLTVYEVRVKVLEQYHYSIPYPHQEMTAYLLAPEGTKRPAAFAKGGKCILFLQWVYGGPGGSTSFVVTDPSVGVQRYEPKMAERLTRLGRRPPGTN